MGKVRSSRLLAGLVAGLLMIGGGAVAANADDLALDGDGIAPVTNGQAANVTMCVGQPATVEIIIAAHRQGNGAVNIFANGSEVEVGLISASPGLSPSVPADKIHVPSGWSALAPNLPDSQLMSTDTVKSVVTIAPQATSSSGTVTFSYAGENASGGAVTGKSSITVNWTVQDCDKTAPTLALPTDVVFEAAGASGATVTYTATATDTNPTSPAVSCTPPSGSVFSIATTTVNCSSTDAAGNTALGSFPVIVRDTTAPVIGQPSDITVEATGASTTVTWGAPTATDIVDGTVATTCSPASGSSFVVGSTVVNCSATDAHRNIGYTGFTVNITDATDPVLVLPKDVTAEATGADGAFVSFVASATDLVDGPLTVTCSPTTGAKFPLGTTTVECSATDQAQNTSSGSFTVTVRDTTVPTVTVPAPIVLEATGSGGAAATFTASASDAVSGSPAATCSPASGSTFGLGVTQVSCSATDAAGNTGSASFTVTVRDTTGPVITVPPETVIVEATGPDGAALDDFGVSASDLVDGSVAVDCDAVEGQTVFALDELTAVECTAKDAAGNTSNTAFAVLVKDTTAPAITVPADITEEATGPSGAAVTFAASATDIVDGAVNVACVPASGSTFPIAKTTVTCSAVDAHSNEDARSFSVTVADTTGPAITVPADIEEEATGADGATVAFSASATDIVDGDVAVTCVPPSGSTFELGETKVTCSAADETGNGSEKSFKVTVVDSTAPAITAPDDITEEATGADGAVVTYQASADDIVDGDVPVTCDPPSGSTFAIETTTVVCEATDAAGNPATKSFSVTVEDTTAPDLTLPAGITSEATSPAGAAVSFTTTASDIVDGDVDVTCFPASGSTFPLGTTPVNCGAVDSAGNDVTESFTVTVEDTTAPTNIVWVGGPAAGGSYQMGSVPAAPTCVATDAVDTAPTCVVTGYGTTMGQHTLTATATDHSGNVTTATRTYRVTWTLKGFYQPVDMNGVFNAVKGGSTVPLKFEIFADATEITATEGIAFAVSTITCSTGAVTDDIELVTTGATSLRYDTTGGQFIQNWQTPKKPGTCYQVVMSAPDGSNLIAKFKLK